MKNYVPKTTKKSDNDSILIAKHPFKSRPQPLNNEILAQPPNAGLPPNPSISSQKNSNFPEMMKQNNMPFGPQPMPHGQDGPTMVTNFVPIKNTVDINMTPGMNNAGPPQPNSSSFSQQVLPPNPNVLDCTYNGPTHADLDPGTRGLGNKNLHAFAKDISVNMPTTEIDDKKIDEYSTK
jgi:hypothetical protein